MNAPTDDMALRYSEGGGDMKAVALHKFDMKDKRYSAKQQYELSNQGSETKIRMEEMVL